MYVVKKIEKVFCLLYSKNLICPLYRGQVLPRGKVFCPFYAGVRYWVSALYKKLYEDLTRKRLGQIFYPLSQVSALERVCFSQVLLYHETCNMWLNCKHVGVMKSSVADYHRKYHLIVSMYFCILKPDLFLLDEGFLFLSCDLNPQMYSSDTSWRT